MKPYTHPQHLQFCTDMETIDKEVYYHRGPFFWQGPATTCQGVIDLMKTLDQTKVPCQWQSRNQVYTVYPLQGMDGNDPEKYRYIGQERE
jgi:hypothetical protein